VATSSQFAQGLVIGSRWAFGSLISALFCQAQGDNTSNCLWKTQNLRRGKNQLQLLVEDPASPAWQEPTPDSIWKVFFLCDIGKERQQTALRGVLSEVPRVAK
jgi:hypothetical protein